MRNNSTCNEQVKALEWSLRLHLAETIYDSVPGEATIFELLDDLEHNLNNDNLIDRKENLLNQLVEIYERYN